jgi:hypothetical protein
MYMCVRACVCVCLDIFEHEEARRCEISDSHSSEYEGDIFLGFSVL